MGESKEYMTLPEENGSINISEEVIAAIAVGAVRDVEGVRTYITSQNHGYAVDSDTVKLGRVRFANANDGTCEGIDYPELKAFTVQFHPEACTGPKDTSFLFDRFVDLMKGGEL